MEQLLTENQPLQYVSTRLVREPTFNRPVLHSPEDAANFLLQRLDLTLDREILGVICFSPMMQVNHAEICSIGTLDNAMIHAREIFKAAILSSSVGVMLFHTHPTSDRANPSREDITCTRKMVEAGDILGIPVFDHFILSGNGEWCSMSELAEGKTLLQYCIEKGKPNG